MKSNEKELMKTGVGRGVWVLFGIMSFLWLAVAVVFVILYSKYMDWASIYGSYFYRETAMTVFLPIFIVGIVFFIVNLTILLININKVLVITDKNVILKSLKGKESIVPVDKISSVVVGGLFNGVLIGSSSYKIRLLFVKNYKEVKIILCDLMNKQNSQTLGIDVQEKE